MSIFLKKCTILVLVLVLHVSIAIAFFWLPPQKELTQPIANVIKGTLVVVNDPATQKKQIIKTEVKPVQKPVKKPVKKIVKKPVKKVPKKSIKKVPKKPVPKKTPKPSKPKIDNKAIAQKVIEVPKTQVEPVSSFQEQAKAPSPNTQKVVTTITPPNVEATHLSNPRPSYPNLSRRRGEEGTVLLEVLILIDGSVGDIRVKKSSGYKRLDKAALRAVKKWRYQPAKKGGSAIEYWYVQPLKFHLEQ